MRVPDKIRSGENFKSAFLRWSDKIVDYLNATKLVGDHKTTAVSQTASGTVVKALRQGGVTQSTSSKVPDGMFHVSLDSEDNKLHVTWDHYADDGYAGFIYLNLHMYMFPDADDITPSEGWLCIKIDSDGTDKEYEIKDSIPGMPAIYYANLTAGSTTPVEPVYYPIAKIYTDENSDSDSNEETWKIYQLPIYQPPHLFAFGTCDEEEAEDEDEDASE